MEMSYPYVKSLDSFVIKDSVSVGAIRTIQSLLDTCFIL